MNYELISNGWELKTVGEDIELAYGKNLPKNKRNHEGKIPVYGSNGIIDYHDECLINEKSIVVGRKGSAGAVTLTEEKFWPIDTTFFVKIRNPEKMILKFAYYLLKYLDLPKKQLAGPKPGINRNDIYKLEYLRPPKTTQKKIVKKLDTILTKIEIKKNEFYQKSENQSFSKILTVQYSEILDNGTTGKFSELWRGKNNFTDITEYLQEIIGENFEKGLIVDPSYQLPKTWVLCKLGYLSDLITKGASPRWQGIQYVDKGTLFITSENVGIGKLLLTKKKYVEEKFNEKQKRSILEKGDLLTNIVGSIGRSALFDLNEKTNINQAVALIRLKNRINNEYVLHVLNSNKMIKFMHAEKLDVGRTNLSLTDVGNFPIPLPPPEEQDEIVKFIHNKLKELELAKKKILPMENSRKKNLLYIELLPQKIVETGFLGKLSF